MRTADFDYELPPELIAQQPAPRGRSRLLVLDRGRGSVEHRSVTALPELLNADDLLLLNEVDVFVDFSSHQAMGLTALEAMACGAAVAVPVRGGASCFARDGHNALLVDTSSAEACRSALETLVADAALREELRTHAIGDAAACYPERPALRILQALFGVPEA